MYEYKAKVVNVVDGDTMDLDIDVGFEITIHTRVRLYGIDTPETRTKDRFEKQQGLQAKEFVTNAVDGKEVTVQTHSQGKFGRYLAVIYYLKDGEMVNLNKELISTGHAKHYLP